MVRVHPAVPQRNQALGGVFGVFEGGSERALGAFLARRCRHGECFSKLSVIRCMMARSSLIVVPSVSITSAALRDSGVFFKSSISSSLVIPTSSRSRTDATRFCHDCYYYYSAGASTSSAPSSSGLAMLRPRAKRRPSPRARRNSSEMLSG